MKVLYLGDIMGRAGQQVVGELLPLLKDEYGPDLIVAQGENLSEGRGMTAQDTQKMFDLGIDFFMGGNWTPYNESIHDMLADPTARVIGPANFESYNGPPAKFMDINGKKVMFVSLLGQIVGKPLPGISNPLLKIEEILDTELKKRTPDVIIVNFHGDYSSEKRIIGYYLDGRVSMVVGDHWHVPTADALVLPNGTAHITDVGMCGSLHSSLGVSLESVIPRWRDNLQTKNELDENKPWQLNAVLVDVGAKGRADSVVQIQKII